MPEPRARRVAWLLFAAALASSVLLSADALLALGVPYDAPYGPVVAKLHPGTYLLLAAWFTAAASRGNPLAVAFRQMNQRRLLTAYLGCMVAVLAWTVFRHGSSGAAYIIQTLWMPAVAIYTLDLVGRHRRRPTLLLVMALLGCNAAVAVGEYLTKAHLVPVRPEGIDLEYFRATAFLGHPLLNANVTVALLPAVLVLPIGRLARAAIGLLLVASLLAFGARTALTLGVLVYGSGAGLHVLRALARGRYDYLELVGGSLALCVGIGLIGAVAAATGLGDRIFQNLFIDRSASVRATAWRAFDYLQGSDGWFGVAPAGIDKIALEMGLDPRFEAIENFWIYTCLQFGAVGELPFLIGIGCLVAALVRLAPPSMRLAILVFFGVASSANALSSKTSSLTLLAVVVAASGAVRSPRAAGSSTFPVRLPVPA